VIQDNRFNSKSLNSKSDNPLDNKIRFYEEYRRRQNSVPGGLIDQNLFDTLAGSGTIRLGSGFTTEERKSVNYLSNERLNRQALKRQFEIAEKQKNYGQVSYGSGQQGRNSRPISDEDFAKVGYATGGTAAVGAGVGAGALPGMTGMTVGASAVVGSASAALVALPVAAIAAGIMFAVQAHQKEQARKKKRKMRTLRSGQGIIAGSRGYTPTGALLSREGAMRRSRSESRDKTSD